MVEEVYPNLYVDGDEGYEKLKGRNNWFYIRACKYGIDGHQQLLGYKTLGAPKGPNYLTYQDGNILALNLLDSDDPNFIPERIIYKAIQTIDEKIKDGKKVLVACNQGRSRGPSIAFLYLKSIGELPDRFRDGFKIFKGIYHKYEPGQGMEVITKKIYSELKGNNNG